MMGPSDRILPLISDIQQVAPTKLSVLISGEAGSGKGVVAKAIHLNSRLSGNPFVMVDCTFPTGMDPEEELFGVEMERNSGILVRKGRIEMASGGTLYLKQVSMLSSRIQKKLGKVLSTGVM
jgi:DNA-binding NtrC family response regulator